MAWVTPRTWTSSELVTAAMGNEQWRDNMAWLYAGAMFHATRSSTQSINSATFTKIQVSTEVSDPLSCYDAATNYRFTPNVAGNYLFVTGISITTGPTLVRLAFYKNGAEDVTHYYKVNAAAWAMTMAGVIAMNGSTDYVELWVRHDSGAAEDVSLVTFSGVRIGA